MATYSSAIGWLNKNNPYFTTYVLRLGRAQIDNHVAQTAQVQVVPGSRGKFELIYNSDFFDTLTDAEAAGVLAHEVMHVILKHLKEIPKFDDFQKASMACEYIVNDTLMSDHWILPEGCFYGIDNLGIDCTDYEVKEVYDLMPDDHQPQSDNGQSLEGSGTPGCVDQHNLSQADADDLKALADQLIDIAKKQAKSGDTPGIISDALGDRPDVVDKRSAGDGFALQKIAEQTGTSVEWIKLLAQVNPDIAKTGGLYGERKTSWHAPRRKLTGYWPNINLPTVREKSDPSKKQGNGKPHIVLALDFSMSIPRTLAQKLASLANAIPDSIDVDCCTFSTHWVPFDHKSKSNNTASGGTDFSAVEDFVRSVSVNVGKPYPKAVVVMTDGEAVFNRMSPTQEQLNEYWSWFMLSQHDKVHPYITPKVSNETVHQLNDYLA